MKNKLLKGFTLIELIIVMAILSILMVGIMQMMKPIRATYVDSTYYEAQRNTQSGIVTYISESVRYATKIGVYQETNMGAAVQKFINNSGYDNAKDGTIQAIVIDNKTEYTFNNEKCYGRVLRSEDAKTTDINDIAATRLALGDAYYGKYTYSINIQPNISSADDNTTPTELAMDGMMITVSSLLPSALQTAKKSGTTISTQDIDGKALVLTEGDVSCLNLSAPINGWSHVDTSLYNGYDAVKKEYKKTKPTTAKGQNTYIIFTLPQ
ncbi:MAG: type II secretion system protein [Oscillospiraceae bacterium]